MPNTSHILTPRSSRALLKTSPGATPRRSRSRVANPPTFPAKDTSSFHITKRLTDRTPSVATIINPDHFNTWDSYAGGGQAAEPTAGSYHRAMAASIISPKATATVVSSLHRHMPPSEVSKFIARITTPKSRPWLSWPDAYFERAGFRTVSTYIARLNREPQPHPALAHVSRVLQEYEGRHFITGDEKQKLLGAPGELLHHMSEFLGILVHTGKLGQEEAENDLCRMFPIDAEDITRAETRHRLE